MKNHVTRAVVAVFLLIAVLTGCSTTVAFDVLKPAEVNMADYRTIAVFDYDPYDLSDEVFAGKLILSLLFGEKEIKTSGYRLNLDDQIADYMTERTIRTLGNTNYFTVAAPEQIRPYQHSTATMIVSNRLLYENLGIEAAIVGSIEDMDFDERVEEKEKQVWNTETEVYDTVIENYLVQEVELGVSYSVIDLKRGTLLATKYLSGRNSQRTFIEDPDTFFAPELEPLYKSIVRSFESQISRQLAPYYVREYRSIVDDKSKDPRSEIAKEYIKDSLYKKALNLYLEMWYDSSNYSAGYNAAIVYEVLGQFDSAIAVIKDVYDATGNPDAYSEYQRLKSVKAEYQKAASQY